MTATDHDVAVALGQAGLRSAVEDFLYYEAGLLDEWRLEEWITLFTDQCDYLVPSTDKPDADPAKHLFLIHDDRIMLEQRVRSLLTKTAHAECPHSRTRRLVTNVRAAEKSEGAVAVRANFAVWRMRLGCVDCYVGRYDYLLEAGGEARFRIRRRQATLDLEALRPHSKLSIIL